MSNNYNSELILNTRTLNKLLKDGPPPNNKYNILGKGSFGTVYKAIYKCQPAAVKLIKILNSSYGQKIIQNESNLLNLKHLNIIEIFEIESSANFGIVIMERIMGPSLQEIVDSKEIPFVHRIYITLDILSALKYIHNRNLLHLDIKPKNIMVSWHDNIINNKYPGKLYNCKLCDFGSCQLLNKLNNNPKAVIKGTIRYMAPEALKNKNFTPATDIYSVGITMWQMKYRIMPYKWLLDNEVVAYQVVKNNIRPNSVSELKVIKPNKSDESSFLQNNRLAVKQACFGASDKVLENFCNLTLHEGGMKEREDENNNRKIANNFCKNLKHPLEDITNKNIPEAGKPKCNLMPKFASKADTIIPSEERKLIVATNNTCKETQYDKLYQSCWDRDQENRPPINNICTTLIEFMHK